MNYEAMRSRGTVDEWRVEAIDREGQVFVTIFSGSDAEHRAKEYAEWKNKDQCPICHGEGFWISKMGAEVSCECHWAQQAVEVK